MTNKLIKIATGEAAMMLLGRELCADIMALMTAQESSFVVFLQGDLGMGKTTLVRGMIRHFGYQGSVKSPTYTLVEPYSFSVSGGEGIGQKTIQVNHFDFYRLTDREELEYLGVRDYFGEHTLNLIEWPERGEGVLPVPDLEITIEGNVLQRILTLRGATKQGSELLQIMGRKG